MWPLKERPPTAAVLPKSDQVFLDQAAARTAEAFRFLRHQPSRPPKAKTKPGRPAPAMGPGTLATVWTQLPRFSKLLAIIAPPGSVTKSWGPLLVVRLKVSWPPALTPQ